MFQEKSSEAVGFDSSWKNDKFVQDQYVQTTEFSTSSQGFNTTISINIETQTDPIEHIGELKKDLEMERLAEWLKKLYPKVVEELNDNSLNNAIAACKYLDMSMTSDISSIQELNMSNTDSIEKQKAMHVSALSWNCTGNTIAVSCALKHDVWCYHQNIEIKLYTFDRDDKLPTAPNKKIPCNSCVTSLAFHLTQPSTLGAGTISGEVYIWNVSNDEISPLYNIHDDRVSLVKWITKSDLKSTTYLVSASLDANLIFWKIDEYGLSIHEKYKPQQYTQKSFVSSADVTPKRTERGIIHFDFSLYVPGLFVVAMEGGFLLKCSLIGAKLIPGTKTSSNILNPYISLFNNHEGEIISLSFSPHRKDLFLSYGTDDQIKIFHIEQETPVQIIFVETSLSNAVWIFCEPQLLAATAEDGSLQLYSLLNGQQIKTDAKFTNESITTMAINHKRINLLAVGYDEGVLRLWSIPWNNIAAQDNKLYLRTK